MFVFWFERSIDKKIKILKGNLSDLFSIAQRYYHLKKYKWISRIMVLVIRNIFVCKLSYITILKTVFSLILVDLMKTKYIKIYFEKWLIEESVVIARLLLAKYNSYK